MNSFDSTLADKGDDPPVPSRREVPVVVEAAARTHVGRVRENNEDHYVVFRIKRSLEIVETNLEPPEAARDRVEIGHAFAVADGMGGMASGEEASRLAILAGLELVQKAAHWHLDLSQPEEVSDLTRTIADYYRQVNRRVVDQAMTHPGMEGMGTTLTVAYSVGLRLFTVNAGDSRSYLFHGGRLMQLTHDHTVAQELAKAGKIPQDDVKSHRMRHVLTNYIGSPGDVIHAEFNRVDLVDGDRLLLCSDGLTDLVDDRQIAAILSEFEGAAAASEALIAAALDAGGRDNVTVIVANYSAATP